MPTTASRNSRQTGYRPPGSDFDRWHLLVVAPCVILILAFSITPYSTQTAITSIAIYCVTLGVYAIIEQQPLPALPQTHNWTDFIRAFLRVLGITALLGYLYTDPDYIATQHSTDTLWLLYVLAIVVVSRRHDYRIFALTLMTSCIALSVVTLMTYYASRETVILDLTTKVLWLALLSFLIHTITRLLVESYVNRRILIDLENITTIRPPISNDVRIIRSICERIAAEFDYPHVNVFALREDRSILCVTGSSEQGRSLADERYALEPDQGIIERSIAIRQPYWSDEVDKNSHYHRHWLFPYTKSELAIPIELKGNVIGAIDIQLTQGVNFSDHEIETILSCAPYVARMLEHKRQIARMNNALSTLAGRLLTQANVNGTLQEIVNAAVEQWDPQLVVAYGRNPREGTIVGPFWAGAPLKEGVLQGQVFEEDSPVLELLATAAEADFEEDLLADNAKLRFGPSGFHRRTGIAPFARREMVQSRVTLPLRAESGTVGLMFVNFR